MEIPQDPRELAGLGVNVAASTVWEILKPTASRATADGPTGPLRSHAEAHLACDLFSVDLFDGTQAHVLTVIEHATRRIRILGVTQHPTVGDWTAQQARNPRRQSPCFRRRG